MELDRSWIYRTIMENEKMKLLAYAKLLNRKIKSLNNAAKNPYLEYDSNPFCRKYYNTLVWVEAEEKIQKQDENN